MNSPSKKSLRRIYDRERAFLEKHSTPKQLHAHITTSSLPWDARAFHNEKPT